MSNISEFTIKVFYAGEKDGKDIWQAQRDVGYGEERFYGRGSTIEEALAETGRKLQAYSDAELAKSQAIAEAEGEGE